MVKYRARFARVNCQKIQFAGKILPGTNCGDERYGKFTLTFTAKDQMIDAPVNPQGRWKVSGKNGRHAPL